MATNQHRIRLRRILRSGSMASYMAAATFVIGFGLYLTLIENTGYNRLDVPVAQQVDTLIEHQWMMHTWYVIIYIVFGLSFLGVTLVFDEILRRRSPALLRFATPLGLIWSGLAIASGMVANAGAAAIIETYSISPDLATASWLPLHFVVNGLGGGNEIVGAFWVTLISRAGLRSRLIPRRLNQFGLMLGIAGLLTIFPASEPFEAVFGMGLIVWFIFIGKRLGRISSLASS